jgi:hypothetical protein
LGLVAVTVLASGNGAVVLKHALSLWLCMLRGMVLWWQCSPLLESAAVCPECERGKQRTPRGSNPRRPAPEEQGMPALLTSRLWLAYRHIHADTCRYIHIPTFHT